MASFRTEGLDHVALAVSDLDRAETFYHEVLGLDRVIPEWDPPRVMASEGSGVALFPDGGDVPDAPPRILHVAFRVDREAFEAAQTELSDRGIDTSFSDHGASHSIYFEDPDGHRLELTTYEV
jgi:catechol-2,3-dioxygenase